MAVSSRESTISSSRVRSDLLTSEIEIRILFMDICRQVPGFRSDGTENISVDGLLPTM